MLEMLIDIFGCMVISLIGIIILPFIVIIRFAKVLHFPFVKLLYAAAIPVITFLFLRNLLSLTHIMFIQFEMKLIRFRFSVASAISVYKRSARNIKIKEGEIKNDNDGTINDSGHRGGDIVSSRISDLLAREEAQTRSRIK